MRYEFTAEEHPAGDTARNDRKPYRATLVFVQDGSGFRAVERAFDGPFALAQVGELSDAELGWRLDARGIPTETPTQSGHGKPDIVLNLSLFAFRPTGIVLGSTCPGDESSSSWTDSARRVRSVRYRVEQADELQVTLHVEGSVETPVNRWDFDGQLTVSLDDGLTGQSQVRERGPGAPAVNDRERIVRITRNRQTPGTLSMP